MARIEKSVEINRSPDEVWNVVGDVAGIANWMPALSDSRMESDTVRKCGMGDAGELTEDITMRDDGARRIEYRITDGPLPIDTHQASMSVDAADGGSRFTWVTEVTPDDLAGAMEPIMEEGVQALKDTVEGA